MTAIEKALTMPWLPRDARVRNMPHERSPERLVAVVAQFEVKKCVRYEPKKTVSPEGRVIGLKTFCNIFIWDVTRALFCTVPHWVRLPELKECEPAGGVELLVNDLFKRWFPKTGAANGWNRASAEQAQGHADGGRPAIVIWFNPSGPGHIALLVPRAQGEEGVWIAQAGSSCFEHARLEEGFGKREVEFWIHA